MSTAGPVEYLIARLQGQSEAAARDPTASRETQWDICEQGVENLNCDDHPDLCRRCRGGYDINDPSDDPNDPSTWDDGSNNSGPSRTLLLGLAGATAVVVGVVR